MIAAGPSNRQRRAYAPGGRTHKRGVSRVALESGARSVRAVRSRSEPRSSDEGRTVLRGRPTSLRLEWLVAPTPEQRRVRFSLVSPPGERSRVDLADGHVAASEAHGGVRHARTQDVLAEASARRGRLCLAPLLRCSDPIGVDHVRLVSSGMLGPPERTIIVRRATLRSDEGRGDASGRPLQSTQPRLAPREQPGPGLPEDASLTRHPDREFDIMMPPS
jgi:hypothetical protein